MTKNEAIKLAETEWWKGLPADVITGFQLFEELLCMPFGEFHKAVEQSLDRPVFTHEFAYGHLQKEFLGTKEKMTLTEILQLIPENKRIVVVM